MQNKRHLAVGLGMAVAAALANTSVKAVDFTTADDTYKFSVNGNINVDYIYSHCQSADTAQAIVTVGGACTGTKSGSSVSTITNGLLPAAITFGVATTQNGYDIAAHFGFYPGIATNDGGSPNLQSNGGAATNVGLGSTGLDIRQVFMTFGNKDMGTFTLGRNFGLFGFDAIINDMTLPGVGVGGAASTASPANTTLGSIGFGYIYVDTLAQIDYTTPTFAGFAATVGIFNPINSLTDNTAAPKKYPGAHAKLTYTMKVSDDMKFYGSVTGVWQKQDFLPTALTAVQYTSRGADAFVQAKLYGFEFDASVYYGKGMGTTGYFILADDGFGNARKSYGGLIQATYTIGPDKFGVNYGTSRLSFANAGDAALTPNLLASNNKFTLGNYYSLTKNLTLLAEASPTWTRGHDGSENKSLTVNAGAYLSF